MRTRSRILGFVILGVITCSCPAAEKQKSSSLEPADLAWLIGDWEGQFAMPGGFPDVGPEGAEVVSVHSWRWTLGKNFISLKIRDRMDGKPASTGSEILGRDNNTGKLGHWFFGSKGFHGGGEWFRDGKTWSLKWRSSEPDGTKYEGVSEHIQVDADTYTWQMRNLKEDGKDIPDWPKVTYRRRVAAKTDEDGLWQAYREAAAGTWQGTGTLVRDVPELGINQGDKFKMRLSFASALDGKAVVGETEFEMVDKSFSSEARVLAGWDPDLRQVRLTAFWSSGTVEEIVLSHQRRTAFLGMYTAKSPGSPTLRARIRIDFDTPDSYRITFIDGPQKGHELCSWNRAE